MTYGSALEADLTVARLESAEIPAVSRGNDIVGIFGPGFQGVTAKGVDVLVPASAVRDARLVLGLDEGDEDEGDEEEEEDEEEDDD